MYIKLTHTGEVTELLPPVQLEDLQNAVGGYIEEFYFAFNNKCAYINEEGRWRQLPYNPIASWLAGVDIVGNVVFYNWTMAEVKKVLKTWDDMVEVTGTFWEEEGND